MLTKVNSLVSIWDRETYELLPYTIEMWIELHDISSITIHPLTGEPFPYYATTKSVVRMSNGYEFDIDDQELERIVELCNKIQRKLK